MDVFDSTKRSRIMSHIKGKNTKPELIVRSLLYNMGYRYRLHRKDLPGKPDIVLPKYRKIIFVHGCFWHGHPGCSRAKRPSSNQKFWDEKLAKNFTRDQQHLVALKKAGWDVLIIWTCEVKQLDTLKERLLAFLTKAHDIKTRKGDTMNAEDIRMELQQLIINFEKELQSEGLREKVLALVPCFHQLRELGKSLIPREHAHGARERILYYFQKYPQIVISGDEILVVSGIQEYARRIRELKVEFGWSIVSGLTAKEMAHEDELAVKGIDVSLMKPSDYLFLSTAQDRDAAHRWNLANVIRRKTSAVRDKLLEYFRSNVGQSITGEELRYVAKNSTEWARRVRELRTEYGWPIVTKNTGRPELEVGVYLLEADRQSPEHDRHIPDPVKRSVLRRDKYRCKKCGWSHKEWNRSDPRHLELHHIEHHVDGGENTEDNLLTVCTVCHDEIHRVNT